MSKKFIHTILAFALLGVFAYIFYYEGLWASLVQKYFPCRVAIAYNLGSFDTKFSLSKKDFLETMQEAEAIWEGPLGKQFFAYKVDDNSKGVLKVNLIYDSRQHATEQIHTLGTAVTATRASYDSLKANYTTMQSNYLQAKSAYDQKVQDYKNHQADISEVRAMETSLNKQVDEINTLVNQINNLAHTLNINVAELNNIGTKRGEEFTEGQYKADSTSKEIDVYEFSTKQKLKTLLAHELGHALGLEHVADPNAIMYYLNQSTNAKLTDADIRELKAICKIK